MASTGILLWSAASAWLWLDPPMARQYARRWEPSVHSWLHDSTGKAARYMTTMRALASTSTRGAVVCGTGWKETRHPSFFVLRDYASNVTEISHVLWHPDVEEYTTLKVRTLCRLQRQWMRQLSDSDRIVFNALGNTLWVAASVELSLADEETGSF